MVGKKGGITRSVWYLASPCTVPIYRCWSISRVSHEAEGESGFDFGPIQCEELVPLIFPNHPHPLPPGSSLASVISTKSKFVNSFTKHSQHVSRGGRIRLCRHLALALQALLVNRGGGPCVQTAMTQGLTCPRQNLIASDRRLFARAVND